MRVVAALLLCAWGGVALAGLQDVQATQFRDLTEVDGLSDSDVTAVIQDKSGFMWLGTEDGLDRYDGFKFQVFRPAADDTESLSDAWVLSLHVDPDGHLWVGTRNGLDRYDDQTETFTRFLTHERRPLVIFAIADAEAGALWLSTDEGFMHLDTRSLQLRTLWPWSPGRHTALLRDKTGAIWVGLDRGLGVLDSRTAQLALFDSAVLDREAVTALHETRSGTIWIGTSSGAVFSLSPDRKHLELHGAAARLAQSPITDIVETADGTLWVGTMRHGLITHLSTPDGWAPISAQSGIRNRLPIQSVQHLYVDRDAKLWVAMRAEGVGVLSTSATYFHTIGAAGSATAPLSSKVVTAVALDAEGRLWVGTINGVNVFSTDFRHVRSYGTNGRDARGLQGHWVASILRDREGRMWLGMSGAGGAGGLCRYQPHTDRFRCYDYAPDDRDENGHKDGVLSLAESPDGLIWVGTEHVGLSRFDPATGQFKVFRYSARDPYSISADTIIDVAADTPGEVWAGTMGGGLDRLDTGTDRFTQIRAARATGLQLPSHTIVSLLQTSKSTLWIGTANGLVRLDPSTSELKSWTTADGLPNGFIDFITEDRSGMLWLGTNFGLVQFDPARGIVEIYHSDDGLPADEFNVGTGARDSNGILYMGTMNGVVAFRPEELPRHATPLHVTLTELLSNGAPVPIRPYEKDALLSASIGQTSTLVLPYSRPHITLAFSALDAPNPTHVRYAFRFKGLDDQWIMLEEDRHSVDYHPETAGHFVFEVRAVSGNGMPLGPPRSLDITVSPAPWASPLAYALYILAAVAALSASIWALWRRVHVERRRHELTRLTESRLQLALRASGEATWTADIEGASLSAPELMEKLGYRDVDGPVMSLAFMQLVHPDDRMECFVRAWAEAVATTGEVDLEFRMLHREGGYLRLQMHGRVVGRDAAGRPLMAAGTFREAPSG